MSFSEEGLKTFSASAIIMSFQRVTATGCTAFGFLSSQPG